MQHLHFFDPKRPVKNPPLIFFLHSATGHARMFQGADLPLLQERGCACVALEAPYARSRNSVQRRGLLDARNERCLWDQTVEELAIALDEALDRWHCDPGRVAFVGLNLGGSIGAYWIAKGAPVRAAIFTGTVPDLTDFWLSAEHPVAQAARAQDGVDLPAYENRMRETDILSTVPKFNRVSTLLQFGAQDPWITPQSRAKAEAALGAIPYVRMSLVEDDHEMRSTASIKGRVSFLEEAIGIPGHF
jgi:pimeloyl-ACP methyl ester carboxylesterase